MKKWVVAWTCPDGRTGRTEPMTEEKDAIDWEARMRCWWPERDYRRLVVETRPDQPIKDLAGPYRTA